LGESEGFLGRFSNRLGRFSGFSSEEDVISGADATGAGSSETGAAATGSSAFSNRRLFDLFSASTAGFSSEKRLGFSSLEKRERLGFSTATACSTAGAGAGAWFPAMASIKASFLREKKFSIFNSSAMILKSLRDFAFKSSKFNPKNFRSR